MILHILNIGRIQLLKIVILQKNNIFPDGSLKIGGTKYFYSPLSGEDIEKEIKPVKLTNFKWFDRLFYINRE